jgi:hypothetical protein
MQDQNQRKYVLTLTGPAATREKLLPAIASFLSPRPDSDTGPRLKGICNPKPDFGGMFNPLAEVIITATPDEKEKSLTWMIGYATRHRLRLHVDVQDLGQQTEDAPSQGQSL